MKANIRMRKLIQERKEKVYCDITGKELGTDYNPTNSFHCELLVANKDDIKECKNEGYNGDAAYDVVYIDIDMCQSVAFEVFNFLKRKYPEAINKIVDTKKNKIQIYDA